MVLQKLKLLRSLDSFLPHCSPSGSLNAHLLQPEQASQHGTVNQHLQAKCVAMFPPKLWGWEVHSCTSFSKGSMISPRVKTIGLPCPTPTELLSDSTFTSLSKLFFRLCQADLPPLTVCTVYNPMCWDTTMLAHSHADCGLPLSSWGVNGFFFYES